jgi:hypothetical protein
MKYKKRKSRCAFALVRGGRCAADCHYNKDDTWEGDCIGNNDPILNGPREVHVNSGFIDGRNVEVDAKGYPIVRPKTETIIATGPGEGPAYRSYGWGTYVENTTGRIFKFVDKPDGTRVRNYITVGRP